MAEPHARFTVADPVRFVDRGRILRGHLARKSRAGADVLGADGGEYRVPWRRLEPDAEGARRRVFLAVERAMDGFRPNDRVRFPDSRGILVEGTIARCNPKTAAVRDRRGDEWRVPYPLLRREAGSPESSKSSGDGDLLAGVAARVENCMDRHGLRGWSFQFDDASKRAGSCDFELRVVTLSRFFCAQASEDDIGDTILHEIAHALVGPNHHHDAVWKAKAREIGCRGRRCHDVDFAPPKWTASCPQCGWRRGANRRIRNGACRKCETPVRYEPWQPEDAEATGNEGPGPRPSPPTDPTTPSRSTRPPDPPARVNVHGDRIQAPDRKDRQPVEQEGDV